MKQFVDGSNDALYCQLCSVCGFNMTFQGEDIYCMRCRYERSMVENSAIKKEFEKKHYLNPAPMTFLGITCFVKSHMVPNRDVVQLMT